jgi:glycerophosphoryl diester phosphodiesterase
MAITKISNGKASNLANDAADIPRLLLLDPTGAAAVNHGGLWDVGLWQVALSYNWTIVGIKRGSNQQNAPIPLLLCAITVNAY